ncbi:MAG: hypothetical protein ACYC1C_10680 [Chloroflexota bacterium]
MTRNQTPAPASIVIIGTKWLVPARRMVVAIKIPTQMMAVPIKYALCGFIVTMHLTLLFCLLRVVAGLLRCPS